MDKDNKAINLSCGEHGDEEKPLKKARYLWEVKGKNYLKNSKYSPNGTKKSESSSDNENLRIANNDDNVINNSSTSIILEQEHEDEYDDSDESPLENSQNENETPLTLVPTQQKNQDYYLLKWQARQIARGFVDNTINSMLETWSNPHDEPIDVTNLVEDFENDGQVEDDAILMAIQSHGLQPVLRTNNNSTCNNFGLNSNSSSSFNSDAAVCGSSRNDSKSPVPNMLHEFSADNFENLQKERDILSSNTFSIETASRTSPISNAYNVDLAEPVDFLNAAVSVAIQKKGLTY